jgi:hypothetical protein
MLELFFPLNPDTFPGSFTIRGNIWEQAWRGDNGNEDTTCQHFKALQVWNGVVSVLLPV